MKDKVMSLFKKQDEIVENKRLLGGTVGHYHIESQGITSPRDFLDRVRRTYQIFWRLPAEQDSDKARVRNGEGESRHRVGYERGAIGI